MRISDIKNAAIILLAFSAIFLTVQLWFDTFSNRNFFYSVLPSLSPGGAQAEGQDPHIVRPYRFIVNLGNTNYDIFYDGLDDNPQKQACDKALEHVLRKGEPAKTEDLDWSALLAGKAYLYDYSFPVPAGFFTEAFGQKSVNLASKIEAVDAVCVTPARTGAEKLLATFIDETSGVACTFSVSAGSLEPGVNDTLLAGFGAPRNENGGMFYVSSAQKELAMFPGNDFVPQWLGDSYTYNVVRMTNPYAPKGDLTFRSIQPGIEPLFDQIVYSGLAGGIYTFSDENTVVRYYPDDTLEYADYHIADKPANPTMASNYRAALAFLQKDAATIGNDYYLSGAQEAEEGVYVFYFDYNVNGFPLRLPTTFAGEVNMRSPIVITAEDNRVSKYKKLVYNFYADSEYSDTACVSFIDFYNGILPEGADTAGALISRVHLAYKMEKSKYLRLHWFMNMNDASIVNPAQFNTQSE